MLPFSGRGLLLDIEGTTSAIAYVYDVMFPFARIGLDDYLDANWGQSPLADACEQIARDAGQRSLADWSQQGDARQLVHNEVVRLMDDDVKATGLKQLQGLIWEAGFQSGALRAHVFADVPPALSAWRTAGVDVRIYSSGSVHAQRMFFGHTEAGDLLTNFSGHYDTTTGPKREADSYRQIANDWAIPAGEILFLSDIVAELNAARDAGMQTGLVLREGNQPVEPGHGHPAIESFHQIQLASASR